MIPAGYLAKRVRIPKGLTIPTAKDVYSLSGCVNDDFADYIQYWKHNGYWLFDSPDIIRQVAQEHSYSLDGTVLFYYEVHGQQFDGKDWKAFSPDASVTTNVVAPAQKILSGFDVVTFFAGNAPECSPLSCNAIAREIASNEHCLLNTFEDAYHSLTHGAFKDAEPGPYRIFAVYKVDWK